MMNQFEFTVKNQALSAIRRELSIYANDELVGEAIRKMESVLSAKEADEKLKIAICGQYSAGKSTLVRALTNDETIAIGQDITTDSVKCYDWEGIQIADTPGIYAGREDHDTLSLDFIQKADLLVYMITIQGFTREIGANFKKLVMAKYADKTMLLMNKRNQEPAENESNWVKDTNDFLGGKDVMEKYSFSIVDIEDYLLGSKENIPELVVSSHFNDFLEKLNRFVREKELIGRIVSKINIVDAMLSLHIEEFSHTEQKNEFTRRQKVAVQQAINAVNKLLIDEELRMRQGVKNLKQKLAGSLTDETMDQFKIEQDNAELELEKICNFSAVLEQVQNISTNLDQDMAIVEKDALAYDDRMKTLLQKYPDIDIGPAMNMAPFKSQLGTISKLMGSVTKDGLIKMVHFFGGKFKPWGAVKCMKWVKVAGPLLAVCGTVLDFVQLAADKKHQHDLENARQAIQSDFGEVENSIANQFDSIKNNEEFVIRGWQQVLQKLTEQENEQIALIEKKQKLLKEFTQIKSKLDAIMA